MKLVSLGFLIFSIGFPDLRVIPGTQPPPGDSIFQPPAHHGRNVSGIVRNNFVKQSDTRSPTTENTHTATKSGSFAKRRILVPICSLSSRPCHCSCVATLRCPNIVKTLCLDRRATALSVVTEEFPAPLAQLPSIPQASAHQVGELCYIVVTGRSRQHSLLERSHVTRTILQQHKQTAQHDAVQQDCAGKG